jgi:hypothetical protein
MTAHHPALIGAIGAHEGSEHHGVFGDHFNAAVRGIIFPSIMGSAGALPAPRNERQIIVEHDHKADGEERNRVVGIEDGHTIPDFYDDQSWQYDHKFFYNIELDYAANSAIHVPGVGPAPIFKTTIDDKTPAQLIEEVDVWYQLTY